MISYLKESLEGTTNKNSDFYKFYLDLEVYFDTKRLKWYVQGQIRLNVIQKTAVGNPVFTLTVNDEDLANTIWMEDKEFSPGEYILKSFTKIYPSSFAELNVYICSTFILDANEEGPGVCVVEAAVMLPITYDASGVLLAEEVGNSDIELRLVNLKETLGYDRYLEFYYKKHTDQKYSLLDKEYITSSAVDYSRKVYGLIPGQTYDFECKVYAADGELLTQVYTTYSVPLNLPVLSLAYQANDEIMLSLQGLNVIEHFDRTIYSGYRLKGSNEEFIINSSTIQIPAKVSAESDYILSFKGLVEDTNYEFVAFGISNGEEFFRVRYTVKTISVDDVEDVYVVMYNPSNNRYCINVRNGDLNAGNVLVKAYVKSPNTGRFYYVFEYNYNFSTAGSMVYVEFMNCNINENLSEILLRNDVEYKLLFIDAATNIVLDLKYAIGGIV